MSAESKCSNYPDSTSSSLQNARLSTDRSLAYFTSYPTVEMLPSKLSATPDATPILKPSITAGLRARMIEGKRHKELEEVKYKHAQDLVALLSANQEAKQESVTTCDAKNKALIHADEGTKMAEVHAEMVKDLSAKIVHLKTVLDSRVREEANENDKLVSELKSEMDFLTRQLENAKFFEVNLVENHLKLSELKLENESYKMQIEDLKSKNEKYESMLDDAKREINSLTNSKAGLEKKELYLMNSVKRSEEEKSCMEFEISRLTNLLKKFEKEARWKNPYQEANSEAIQLRKVASDAKAESASLINRENELEKNDELRKREMALLVQVEVLSNLLGEILAEKNKQEEENGCELTDSSEKDYDVLPKWTSFMQINEKHVEVYEVESLSGKLKNGEGKEEENEDYLSEVDMEMWESFKIDEKDSYIENDANGVMMMMKKKKKPLLGKIGSLLRKG